MKESPEEILIRTIREMQKHWYDILLDDKKLHSRTDGDFLLYARNQYNLLTELIDLYDNSISEQKEQGVITN